MFGWLVLGMLILSANSYYCFSRCSGNTNTSCLLGNPFNCAPGLCLNSIYNGCYTSANIIAYSDIATNMTASTGYISTNTTPYTCIQSTNTTGGSFNTTIDTLFSFTAQLVSTDYIYKNYSLPNPHYQVLIRMSIAFIGVWSPTDYLRLVTWDGIMQNSFALNYNCTSPTINYTETICNSTRSGNHVDCIMFYDFQIGHNTSWLLVNWSSLTMEKDPLVQFWSPFDITIAYKSCHLNCLTCWDSANTNCYTCASGSYLNSNNTCLPACPVGTYKLPSLTLPTAGVCVSPCPQGYYPSGLFCLPCQSGCLSCSSATVCLVSLSDLNTYSLWLDKIAIWIILIILGIILIAALIYRFCFYASPKEEEAERIISEFNDTKPNDDKITVQEREQPENNHNYHIEEIDFKDHVMVDNNPRKRKRQERDMNRSNSHF